MCMRTMYAHPLGGLVIKLCRYNVGSGLELGIIGQDVWTMVVPKRTNLALAGVSME